MDTARTLEEKRERVLEQMRAIRSMGDVPPDVEFWVAAAPWPA